MFETYASLGTNCEVGFQFRRVLGVDQSSFFNWNISPLPAIAKLLRNDFAGIMEAANIAHETGDLFQDKAYGYWFHADMDPNGALDDAAWLAVFRATAAKFAFFVDRFRRLKDSAGRTTFFHRTSDPITRDDAAALHGLLTRHIPAYRFVLIVLQAKDSHAPMDDWNLPGVANRYLDRLAPDADATDGHVASWDRVFAEFPHRLPMRLAGF